MSLATQPHAPLGTPTSSRVCDSCIRKKVKCDLNKPTCSRCSERGYVCNYSSIRRKPGPPRGSRRAVSTGTQRQTPVRNSHRSGSEGVGIDENECAEAAVSTPTPQLPSGLPSIHDNEEAFCHGQLPIKSEERDYLLERFIDTIHEAIPIFTQPEKLRSSDHSRDLIYTIVVLTGKLMDYKFSKFSELDLSDQIERLLSSSAVQEELLGNFPSLDELRKACLLAFYEFHQFPGQQAWMRTSKLIRMAYWIGLDQFDVPQGRFSGRELLSEVEVHDWRLLWWCMYRLDSYSNLAAGTPYLIEEATMHVTLPEVLETTTPPALHLEPSAIFLSRQLDCLWKIVPSFESLSENAASFNFHILTVTAMRQVGRTLRFKVAQQVYNPSNDPADLHQQLALLRLALPSHYLNPMRNALENESSLLHHQRLVSVLHLYFAKLLIAITSCRIRAGREEWLLAWQQVLETSQDIAYLSQQWNAMFTLQVDPAISFIMFSALVFIHIQRKSLGANSSADSGLESLETMLVLQLKQFSARWTQPQLLILAFNSVRGSLCWGLSQTQIEYIMSHFEAPLHPRWIQFLLSIQNSLENMPGNSN